MFHTRMQAKRRPQELPDNEGTKNLNLSFRPELLSTFYSEHAPDKKTAAVKAGLAQPVPASTSEPIKPNQGKSRLEIFM